MIIQVMLIAGLLACLFYAYLQRKKSRLVMAAIAIVALAGIYFVLSPDSANALAGIVGVGRGADLILYCWLVISLAVSINLQFRILTLQGHMTELVREMALQAARSRAGEQDA